MASLHLSSFQDQIADITECSICADIYTDPKILPCVHTFCLHCLEKYGKEKKPGDEMVCPLCRKEFLIPNGGFSFLPSNFFIGKMVEIGKQAMTPTTNSVCALCPEEDAVLAQKFCVDCDQNLCTRCGNGHKKSRFSQHHQVIELGSQVNTRELNLRNCYCDHHPGEMIKMFCYEDKVAICLICCVESHQSHRCVNVNKAAEKFVEQLKQSSAKVTGRLSECQEFSETLDRFKKEFQAEVLKTEEGICDATKRLTMLIQQQRELLLHQLKTVAERNIKAFETTKLDVDRFRVMIDSYSNYSDKLLTQGSPVDVCRAVDQMLTRAQELATLPANCSGESFCSEVIAFKPSYIENILKPYGLTNTVGELTVTPCSDWLLQFDCKTSDAKALIEKGHITHKSHTLVISKPSKPEPVKESNESVQQRFSNVVNEAPDGNASGHEQSVSEGMAIDVANIPEDLTETSLVMIFESKRHGGGGEVKNIIYDKERRSAAITLSDPEVAKRLVSQESVVFKDTKIMVTKHVEEDRSQKPFPSRKRSNISTEVKEQPSLADRTITVTNIPSDVNKETLEMVFENKRNSGGVTENVVSDQNRGTAVITFKDPEGKGEAETMCDDVEDNNMECDSSSRSSNSNCDMTEKPDGNREQPEIHKSSSSHRKDETAKGSVFDGLKKSLFGRKKSNDSLADLYVASMLLSGVGDALGYRNGRWEFNTSGPNIHRELREMGGLEKLVLTERKWPLSDDTVMHIATAEALVDFRNGTDKEELYKILADKYVECMNDMEGRAAGPTTIQATNYLRTRRTHLLPFNSRGEGCGAAMKAMCVGLRYPRVEDLDDLIVVSIESGRLTNHNPTGYLGALASALFTSYAIQRKAPVSWGRELMKVLPRARKYIERKGRDVEENLKAWSYFGDKWREYLEERKIADEEDSEPSFPPNFNVDVRARDAFYAKYSFNGLGGASGHDAPMIAYDALLGSEDSWSELCLRGMLHGGDSNSTGAIAAAWFGALYGRKNVPENHYKHLEYRNRIEKLGTEIYELTWVKPSGTEVPK